MPKGSSWYLGAMRAGEKGEHTNQSVWLDFLPPGRYRAEIWEDGDALDAIQYREVAVTANSELKLRVAPAGGAAVILKPQL